MKISELHQFDNSFELVSTNGKDYDCFGVSTVEIPEDGHIVFLKSTKYLNRVGRFSDRKEFKKTGVILEKSFYTKLQNSPEIYNELADKFLWVGTSKDVNLSMSYFSKPFYKEFWSSLNHDVDGRKMGSTEIHPSAFIAQDVFIGENVFIGKEVRIHPGAVIMSQCRIGDGTEIFPNVTIYPKVEIGQHCRIHGGVTIGSDGFGYNFDNGVHQKVYHMGGVKIGDNVEIGANTAVDGGTFSPTLIGSGTKLDNLVQIGHNARLGNGVVLCGGVMVGGSAIIGNFCVFGGCSAIGDNFEIGDGCQVAGAAMVNADWPAGTKLGGHPARPLREWLKGMAYLRKMSLSN